MQSKACQATDPIGLSLTVEGDATYREAVLSALRDICPLLSGADIVVWTDEKTKKENATLVVPPDWCKQEWQLVYGTMPNGERCSAPVGFGYPYSEGHWTGCQLLLALICSDCTVKIREGTSGNPDYEADNPLDTMPKGMQGVGEGGSEGGSTKSYRGTGTGKGSGGSARITAKVIKEGLPSGYSKDPNSKKGNLGRIDGRALLAHELAHALRGCNAESRWNRDWSGCDKDKLGKDADPANRWQNREEYDVINEWENPIAEELGKYGRTGHG